MKDLLYRLEKSTATWVLLITLFIFFLLRLPSLVEPYWYGDEGIYEVIGSALRHGVALYSGIWDNKPPLLYLTYALFSGDQFSVKLLSLIFGLLSVIVFFFLSKKLFSQPKIQYLTTIIFALLFATPVTEGDIANAENFMLLPILLAAYLVYNLSLKRDFHLMVGKGEIGNSIVKYQIWAGLLLGIASLYKVVAIFDFAALGLFLFFSVYSTNYRITDLTDTKILKPLAKLLLPFAISFFAPLVITLIYFTSNGAGVDFLRSAFSNNVGYVGYGNTLVIPQGFLILKVLILLLIVWWLYRQRKIYTKETIFILLWFTFEIFDSFFSQRNYTHYFLMSIISISLLVGLPSLKNKNNWKIIIPFAALAVFTIVFFINIRFINLPGYYQNYLSYITNHKSVDNYRSFFDKTTTRDYAIADYLKQNTKPYSKIFIWGNSAQIYVLSKTLPVGRYTVAYHITGKAIDETQSTIENQRPKFIVVLSDISQFPFIISNYQPVFSMSGNIIYEKNI